MVSITEVWPGSHAEGEWGWYTNSGVGEGTSRGEVGSTFVRPRQLGVRNAGNPVWKDRAF